MFSLQRVCALARVPIVALAVASSFSSLANSQVAELVDDLTPGLEAATARWWNRGVVDTPSLSYLQLSDRGSRPVLWATEGTPESTYPIMDLAQQWDVVLNEDNPTTALAGDSLFFIAPRSSNGGGLWTARQMAVIW